MEDTTIKSSVRRYLRHELDEAFFEYFNFLVLLGVLTVRDPVRGGMHNRSKGHEDEKAFSLRDQQGLKWDPAKSEPPHRYIHHFTSSNT